MRRSAWLGLLILAGCAGTPGGPEVPSTPPDEEAPKIIKVSYLRYDYVADPRTQQKKWIHSYRIMLSEGWTARDRSPRERFLAIYRDPFFCDSVPDEVLARLVEEIRRKGFDQLQGRDVESINLDDLKRAERTGEKDVLKWKRIIQVETDTWKKCVTLEDNDDTARGAKPVGPLTRAFLDVERAVLQVAMSFTIQVTVEKDPARPR